MGKSVKIALGIVALIAVLALGASAGYAALHRDRIYPGVTVAGYDVGGMTQEEAADHLGASLPPAGDMGVNVQGPEQLWRITWAAVGQRYDLAAMAGEAYAVGRDAPLLAWRLRSGDHDIDPTIVPADPALVREYLAKIAAVVDAEPVEAQLVLENGVAVATPAASGQKLDVETTADRMAQALAEGAETVGLVLVELPPTRESVEPAYGQAQALLAQPFTLVASDPLTGERPKGYYAEFSAPPEIVAGWLHPRHEAANIALDVDSAAVRTWLEEIAPQVAGETRYLDVAETFTRTTQALAVAEPQARARIRHAEQVYYVEPGDFFYDIAYFFGFSQWQLERANPNVDPEGLYVGQPLTIPSIDVLFPHPLVPEKRIEIDLPTQTLYAYENDELNYEFKISSGISTTPTLAGQFQILFKEEDAFAQRWSLDMPYFMGIYEEREGFFNGIHELPITNYGARLSPGVLGGPASFGCIIVDSGDAESLFNWAPLGTLVRIDGVAPGTPTWEEILSDLVSLTSEDNPPPEGTEP